MLWANLDLYNPWNELNRIRGELNRTLSTVNRSAEYDFPAINLWSNADEFILTCELPGVDVKDVDLITNNDTLTLKGERKPDVLEDEERYHRQERTYGKFARTIKLPCGIDNEKVEATFEKGILKVRLPQDKDKSQKKITIKGE